MIFRPDIKPPIWGPPDAVQYAVRANAERLGIDPATLLSIHPLWSGAGDILDSLGSASAGSRNTATWNAEGLITSSGNGLTATTTLTNPSARQHTVVSVITLNQNRKQGFYQRRETAAGAGLVVGQFDTGGVVRAYVVSSLVSQRSAFVPAVGKQFSSCVVMDLNLANESRVKMFFDGMMDASTASGTHPTSTLVTYASEIGYASAFAGFSWLRMDGIFHFYADFDGAISNDAACALTSTPYALIMPVSRPVYFDLGAGGGTYTETLDTLITSISSAADRQAYRETVDTLITSGATVDAVTGMVEALLSLGVSASTAADVQGYADGVSDTIISASDTAAAQDYVDGPATTGVSSSAETDTQAYTDTLADTLVSTSNVTDTTGAPPLAESLLTTAVSASHVSAAQAYVDTVTTLAHSSSSLAEVLGLVEQIGTVGESVSAVSDRQLYYDNVAIVALSSSSLAEVGAYIEQVAAAAVSASSLTDVLVGSFVGRYVFADYCRPRSFADYARPRSFEDYCRPRGRRLQ